MRIFAFIFMITSYLSAQNQHEFLISQKGIEPLIVNVPGKSKEELYTKALEWLQVTFESPEHVLKAKIINKSIRINAIEKDALVFELGKVLGNYHYDLSYSLEIDFKPQKYRYTILVKEFSYKNGEQKLDFSYLFKPLKKEKQKLRAKKALLSLNNTIQKMHASFYEYVSESGQASDDW